MALSRQLFAAAQSLRAGEDEEVDHFLLQFDSNEKALELLEAARNIWNSPYGRKEVETDAEILRLLLRVHHSRANAIAECLTCLLQGDISGRAAVYCIAELRSHLRSRIITTSSNEQDLIQLFLGVIAKCTGDYNLDDILLLQPFILCLDLVASAASLLKTIDILLFTETIDKLLSAHWQSSLLLPLTNMCLDLAPALLPQHRTALQRKLIRHASSCEPEDVVGVVRACVRFIEQSRDAAWSSVLRIYYAHTPTPLMATLESILEQVFMQNEIACAAVVAEIEDTAVLQLQRDVLASPFVAAHWTDMLPRPAGGGDLLLVTPQDVQLLLLLYRVGVEAEEGVDTPLLRALLVALLCLLATAAETGGFKDETRGVQAITTAHVSACVESVLAGDPDRLDDSFTALTRARDLVRALLTLLDLPTLAAPCTDLLRTTPLQLSLLRLVQETVSVVCRRCYSLHGALIRSLLQAYAAACSAAADSKRETLAATLVSLCEMDSVSEHIADALATHFDVVQALSLADQAPLVPLLRLLLASPAADTLPILHIRKLLVNTDAVTKCFGIQLLCSLLGRTHSSCEADVTNSLLYALSLPLPLRRVVYSQLTTALLADLQTQRIPPRCLLALKTKILARISPLFDTTPEGLRLTQAQLFSAAPDGTWLCRDDLRQLMLLLFAADCCLSSSRGVGATALRYFQSTLLLSSSAVEPPVDSLDGFLIALVVCVTQPEVTSKTTDASTRTRLLATRYSLALTLLECFETGHAAHCYDDEAIDVISICTLLRSLLDMYVDAAVQGDLILKGHANFDSVVLAKYFPPLPPVPSVSGAISSSGWMLRRADVILAAILRNKETLLETHADKADAPSSQSTLAVLGAVCFEFHELSLCTQHLLPARSERTTLMLFDMVFQCFMALCGVAEEDAYLAVARREVRQSKDDDWLTRVAESNSTGKARWDVGKDGSIAETKLLHTAQESITLALGYLRLEVLGCMQTLLPLVFVPGHSDCDRKLAIALYLSSELCVYTSKGIPARNMSAYISALETLAELIDIERVADYDHVVADIWANLLHIIVSLGDSGGHTTQKVFRLGLQIGGSEYALRGSISVLQSNNLVDEYNLAMRENMSKLHFITITNSVTDELFSSKVWDNLLAEITKFALKQLSWCSTQSKRYNSYLLDESASNALALRIKLTLRLACSIFLPVDPTLFPPDPKTPKTSLFFMETLLFTHPLSDARKTAFMKLTEKLLKCLTSVLAGTSKCIQSCLKRSSMDKRASSLLVSKVIYRVAPIASTFECAQIDLLLHAKEMLLLFPSQSNYAKAKDATLAAFDDFETRLTVLERALQNLARRDMMLSDVSKVESVLSLLGELSGRMVVFHKETRLKGLLRRDADDSSEDEAEALEEPKKTPVHTKKKARVSTSRSRNSVINEWLTVEDQTDNFADLEDFIV